MSKRMRKADRPAAHFLPDELRQPYNPITVNLIGAGGTGSQVLTALARINHALQALEHPGLFVRVYDDDVVTAANLGRQLFTTNELGQYKSVVLINRVNRFFGTNWKAETLLFDAAAFSNRELECASLIISCVDTVAARFGIQTILQEMDRVYHGRNRIRYWLDYGNSRTTGQVLLATIGKIKQPDSSTYRTIEQLSIVTEEFRDLLNEAGQDNTPSCSLADALTKQDLFINSVLANAGASLLWQMLREGKILNRGFFLNLENFCTQPLKVA